MYRTLKLVESSGEGEIMLSNMGLSSTEWEQIYSFLLECGRANSPDELAETIIDGLRLFVPYDTASVYLLDGSGKICSHHLRGVDERWNKIYLAYYIYTDNERYNIFRNTSIVQSPGEVLLNVYNWEQVESVEFVPDFVRARGLLHTCGFGLPVIGRKVRITFCLDRTQSVPFQDKEINLLRMLIPLLRDFHKNFFALNTVPIPNTVKVDQSTLTSRETQIAELLCQSMSPAEISQHLHIAQSTTYKHIANIYAKLNVSSQRQLLAKLLNPKKHVK